VLPTVRPTASRYRIACSVTASQAGRVGPGDPDQSLGGVRAGLEDLEVAPTGQVEERGEGSRGGYPHPMDEQIHHGGRLGAQLHGRRPGYHRARPQRPRGEVHDEDPQQHQANGEGEYSTFSDAVAPDLDNQRADRHSTTHSCHHERCDKR
jgi:hypothetical protein